MRRVLLTDVDNTLFSWIDYFAPCFRALVHAVARDGRLPEDGLYDSFQLVFQREGTVEYRKALQDNLLIRDLPEDKQRRLIHVGTVAFGQAMRKHLKPYEGVAATLRRLRRDHVLIVAVTNSGALQAMSRLKRLGLAKLLDGLVAWNHDVAGIAESQGDYKTMVQVRLRTSGLPWVIALQREELKPCAAAYVHALQHLGLTDAKTWVIGDSLHKDLSPALDVRATSVWAKYGHAFNQRNFDTLIKITHWSPEKIRATYDTEVLTPDHVVEDFTQLIDVIGLSQGELF